MIEGKGVLNNRISEYLFQKLERDRRADAFHPPAQHARAADPRGRDHPARGGGAQRRRRLAVDSGSASRRARSCRARSSSSITRTTQLGDPMVSEEHITAFGWATPQEIDDIMALAIRVNDFLSGVFLGVGIRLVDFKWRFGRLWENEHDAHRGRRRDLARFAAGCGTSRRSDKLDKDRFRRDMGGLVEAYHGGRQAARHHGRRRAAAGHRPGAGEG